MDSILDVSPGLIFWTFVNFSIFFFLILKFAAKPIAKGLKARSESIQNNIDNAAKANEEAKRILAESQEKLNSAQQEMAKIVSTGRTQAEELIRKATDEADKVKHVKVEEAKTEIERSKAAAIKELRTEVAGLVVMATEKIIGETLDKEKHHKLVESYIEKLPQN